MTRNDFDRMPTWIQSLKWPENNLLPVIVQDINTNQVLMLAYANPTSVHLTFKEKKAHFYSRSRQTLWKKGETSGNFQTVKEIRCDCDQDTLLYLVSPDGPACHTGEETCFFQRFENEAWEKTGTTPGNGNSLLELAQIIESRKSASPDSSYTASLFAGGIDRILRKIGEESAETIVAAKNDSPKEIVAESADLIYHLLVMLSERNVGIEPVLKELANRRK